MATRAKSITFVVPGAPDAPAREIGSTVVRGRVKHSVRVAASRGEGTPVRVEATPGQDVVVLHIADGPQLVLHPENARDLLLAQATPSRPAGTARSAARGIDVPVRLQWSGVAEAPSAAGTARGLAGVLLSKIEVLTPALKQDAADLAASEVVRRVDAQVDAGVYQLSPDALQPLKGKPKASNLDAAADGKPILVLVHGTFSTTAGTFSQLWVHHPDQVRALFQQYGGRVYGLDHPTLGASPIDNALTLARVLPRGARVHLLTHSRGGLVAEVLARTCGDPDDDFAEFSGAAYQSQKNQLRALAALVKKNQLQVDRVVRVACPARGTLLASKRVDAYVSVFKWTLELAGLPVAAEILDFLAAVARKRTDPTLIPGLAAQVPDSALIRWIHSVDRQVNGQLRVIAGDLQGDSISSWLKTLLTDAFYWTDHDLVVQTRSMYGGSPRQTASTFVLDQGGKVTHFNYFSNDRTARAMTNALTQDAPQEFTVIGPMSWAGESATGARARISKSTTSAAASLPAVFILPGILGSNLKIGANRIWVSWRLVNGLQQLAFTGKPDKVEPDGLVGSTYDNLTAFLSSTHEVVQFAFDWRRPIEEEARRLATSVSAALDARAKSKAPVRFVAHSMGGLVARTMQLEEPRVWSRMMSQDGARVLMLGTPNAGSFAPMQVLSGDDTFGNLLALVGAPFQGQGARTEMAGFPGFIQLQAGLTARQPLASAGTWQKLADEDWQRAQEHQSWHNLRIQLDALRWGVPTQEVLDAGIALRRRLDAQLTGLDAFAEHLALVVGTAPFTPAGYVMSDTGLIYSGNATGDGRVTLDQALLPGVRTWRVAADHGSLPDRRDAFTAYQELLEKGSTTLIEALPDPALARGIAAPVEIYSRPSRAPQKGTPPRVERQALESAPLAPAIEVSAGRPALRVTVLNGDLTYLQQPLIIGHYRSMRLTGTEAVVDRLLGHTMRQSLRVGTYPDEVGSSRVFTNLRPAARTGTPRGPDAIIVVGLGEEAKLRGPDLVRAVRQGVLAWAQRLSEQRGNDTPEFELAATLIGSGGTGISAGQSAQLVAQGVFEANERLADEHEAPADDERGGRALGRVGRLVLSELYLDRASEALRALQLQEEAAPGRFAVDAVVETGTGSLERPVDASYRGADYDLITAVTRVDPQAGNAIEYTLDTRRARTEVRAQHAQSELLSHLVALASNDTSTDARIGRTLFQLLVPIEIEPYLAGSTEMLLEVDRGTAGIPWELLDTDAEVSPGSVRPHTGSEPWAVRTRLLRKLRIENAPERPDAGVEGSALVIGEPKCDPDKYPRLAGARAEAKQVSECLSAASALGTDRVEDLISPDDPQQFGPDARQVLNALFDRDRTWRIIHIAGHGEPATDTDPGGVVLSDGFLTATEISAMRKVPELVFVNCCYLAARSANQLLRSDYDRVRFAAGVAEELIRIGVRCVIAAGWAVDDEAAGAFSTTFYRALLGGRRFLDAVHDARRAALTLGGNTWAAYQCYGDPDWMFRRDTPDAQRPSLDDQFQGVLSASSLARALNTLAVQSEFQGARPEIQRDRIRFLEDKAQRSAPGWLHSGCVAEAFGRAAAATGDLDAAVRWYAKAVEAVDGTASLNAVARLEELRAPKKRPRAKPSPLRRRARTAKR